MLAASARGPGGSYRQNDDFYELAGVGPDRSAETDNFLIINLRPNGSYLQSEDKPPLDKGLLYSYPSCLLLKRSSLLTQISVLTDLASK